MTLQSTLRILLNINICGLSKKKAVQQHDKEFEDGPDILLYVQEVLTQFI